MTHNIEFESYYTMCEWIAENFPNAIYGGSLIYVNGLTMQYLGNKILTLHFD